MQEQEQLHQFLCRLITDSELLRAYLYEDEWTDVIDDSGLSDENKEILKTGDLRAAMDVIKEETGADILFWVIKKVPWVI